MTTTIQVSHADIILKQLGGQQRLKLVMGAKDFFSDDNGNSLVFKIGKGANNGIGHIKIHLNIMDTYDVTFTKITRKKDPVLKIFLPDHKVIAKHEGIYCDDLKSIIENETGFFFNPLG